MLILFKIFGKEQASKIPWFARVEICYKQPRGDNKLSELAFYRGRSETDLHVFKERQELGYDNCSHNRSSIMSISYSEIEDVIVLTPRKLINQQTGGLIKFALSKSKFTRCQRKRVVIGKHRNTLH